MPEQMGRDIRDRMEALSERQIKADGRMEGHEQVCSQRYNNILEKVVEIKSSITVVTRVGLAITALLLSIEFGRSTWPAIFDLLTKGH